MTNKTIGLLFIMIGLNMATFTLANDIYITQIGDNLDLDITQDGTNNKVGNSTTSTSINGDGMNFDITQTGNLNTIVADINGVNYTGTWVFTGSSNTVDLDCSSSAAGDCDDVTLNITATGDDNVFTFDVGEAHDGSNTVANFTITGDHSIINSTINGKSAELTVIINNSSSLATTSTASDEGVAFTSVQTGNGDSAGHSAVVSITGGGGTMDINQSGINDQKVNIGITGNSFDVDITQSD